MPEDTMRFRPMLDFIAQYEGTAKQPGGGYNTSLGYGAFSDGEHELVSMTLDKIDGLQTRMLKHPQNHFNSSALGRYQIVRTTLRGLREQLDLSSSTLFSADLQDILGSVLIRRRGRNPNGLRQEWASLHSATDSEIFAAFDADGNRFVSSGETSAAQSVNFESEKSVASSSISDTHSAIVTNTELNLLALAKEQHLNIPATKLLDYWKTHNPEASFRYWAIINFEQHSSASRLYIFDVTSNSVAKYLCAHGKGSEGAKDDGYATVFSNKHKSNASSLGIYRCAEEFFGKHSQSMRLDGLEATNSNARNRGVYLHSAIYVSQEFIDKTKRIGRSKGCPAVEIQHVQTIINKLKNGSYLLAWRN